MYLRFSSFLFVFSSSFLSALFPYPNTHTKRTQRAKRDERNGLKVIRNSSTDLISCMYIAAADNDDNDAVDAGVILPRCPSDEFLNLFIIMIFFGDFRHH